MDLRVMPTRKAGAVLLAAVALVASLTLTAAPASPAPGTGKSASSLAPALFDKGLESSGRVVRRDGGVEVTRVKVTQDGEERVLYRVKVKGNFPPRALRYVVTAGGVPIGYGLPTPGQRAVQTVTDDARVLEVPIAADYEGGAAPSSDREDIPSKAPATMDDPSLPGPHEVTTTTYDLGDQVFQPTDIGRKVEITAEVRYPTDIAGGPYPLVVFLHGNHSTCYKGKKSRFQWPCRTGWEPIPNYAGYGYLAESLASHGYVVVSVSTNGVNVFGSRLEDTGMRQRGELIDEHLDLWNTWSTVGDGPFEDTFVGNIDMTRIGTMGHSRGGEGVVWHKIVDDERADPYGIDAVLSLAPVDFTRTTINEVPYATMLPYCDGDVSDLQGVHFFDDSRYNVPGDPAPKHTVTFFKANHNFYNTVWSPSSGIPGSVDDGQWSNCRERLGEKRQRRIGRAYMVGFFRRYLAEDQTIDPMWTGADTPDFTSTSEVLVSYLAPDSPAYRMDVARFTDPSELGTNRLGGAMTPANLNRYGWCANEPIAPCVPEGFEYNDIHLGSLSEAILGWRNHSGSLGMELPLGSRDVSAYDAFQFRATVPPGYQVNSGSGLQDLSVALIDGNGDVAQVAASEVGNDALVAPSWSFSGHTILNQIRFDLDLFTGVDLSDIREVQIRFDRTLSGVVNIADVAFSSGGAVMPPN